MIASLLLAAVVAIQPVPFAAPAEPGAAVATPATTALAPTARSVAPRYCIIEAPTGSRIPRKVCETRADWAAKGVTIP
ncbi:hypothetical protein SAMN06297144_2014 [Sphingomonas guangdongensis]|uniref:Uncharacterized protein n=1 Tax=Sphingomonas guangdongensis TaxID=1141890 RepID=A0A285QYA8_9SPHN|nr:hypothetical protein [Sphingomonas guangdongensis]SOB86903.1 hypothetical protein SAMN06297144_2014 [Sphingomonas guangdongensis]